MFDKTEAFIEREEIYNGAVLHVVRDKVRTPSGKEAYRELAIHNGAVAIIPVTNDGFVIMERQYRYAHQREMLEIPAGKLDSKDEVPLLAAKRELREETGAVAEKYTYLGELIPTPAIVTEKIHMYLAENLSFGECEPDEDEFIDIGKFRLKDLCDMVMRGEICDAKTQIAILKLSQLRPELMK